MEPADQATRGGVGPRQAAARLLVLIDQLAARPPETKEDDRG